MAQHIFTGTAPPATTPTAIGQHFIDTSNGISYVSVGTSSSADWKSTSGGATAITALTGDVTASGPGSAATTLATVNAGVGSFGTATQTSAITVNAKGLVTAAANTSIAIPSTQVTDFTEAAQDAVGAMVDSTIVYTDGTPLLSRAALTGDVTASAGSNATTLASTYKDASFGITIDGGGAAITTGVKGYVEIPFAGTITGWTITGDTTGSIVIDVWKDTYANYPPDVSDSIAGSEKPTITTGVKGQDLSLSTWTGTTVTKGDVVGFNVDSCTAITRVTLVIRMTRT